MAKKYRLQEVTQLNGKAIFFDANILIYLFWPTGQYSFERNYASVFRSLLRQGNALFVNFLVISEIVNRAIKTEYEKHLLTQSLTRKELKYKAYRNSQEGQDALKDICIIVKDEILSRFDVVEKSFDKQEIEGCLVVSELDFVDKALVVLCKENNLILLTNDRDYKSTDLDILTGNPNFF